MFQNNIYFKHNSDDMFMSEKYFNERKDDQTLKPSFFYFCMFTDYFFQDQEIHKNSIGVNKIFMNICLSEDIAINIP